MFSKLSLKYKILLSLGILAFLFISFIAYLEIGSRNTTCSLERTINPSICGDYSIFDTIPDPDEDQLLVQSYRLKRQNKERITRSDYATLFNLVVTKKSGVEMGHLNGISCGNYGYVRDDMPKSATLYVQRHELEHILQDREAGNLEFAANWAAFKEYPFGMIQTVFFTIGHGSSGPFNCRLFILWNSFKKYFLPFEGNSSPNI